MSKNKQKENNGLISYTVHIDGNKMTPIFAIHGVFTGKSFVIIAYEFLKKLGKKSGDKDLFFTEVFRCYMDDNDEE